MEDCQERKGGGRHTHTQTHAQLTAPPPFITDRVCCRCTVSESDRKDVGDP